MSSNARELPRRRSMSDASFLLRNPGAGNAVRDDLINMVEGMRQHNSRLDEFANSLPKLTERDIAALGHSDSNCPICLTPLLAIVAEEETAVAMESPAHPVEELGVTRLAQTCGHIFCRKDIRGWMYQGHTTCPTCRTRFIAQADGDASAGASFGFPMGADASFDAFLENEVTRAFETFLRGPSRVRDTDGNDISRPGRQLSDEEEELPEVHFEYNHDRYEFSGMYS